MKEAEKILRKHIDKESMDELSVNVWPEILDAMEEYRKQPTFVRNKPDVINNVEPVDKGWNDCDNCIYLYADARDNLYPCGECDEDYSKYKKAPGR